MKEKNEETKKQATDKEKLQQASAILAAANVELQREFVKREVEKRKKMRGTNITLMQSGNQILVIPGEDRLNEMTREELEHYYSPHDIETKIKILKKFDACNKKRETLSTFIEEKKREKDIRLRFLLDGKKEKEK